MIRNGVTNTSKHIGIPINKQKPKPDIRPNNVAKTPTAERYIGDRDNELRKDKQIVATIIMTMKVTAINIISIIDQCQINVRILIVRLT